MTIYKHFAIAAVLLVSGCVYNTRDARGSVGVRDGRSDVDGNRRHRESAARNAGMARGSSSARRSSGE